MKRIKDWFEELYPTYAKCFFVLLNIKLIYEYYQRISEGWKGRLFFAMEVLWSVAALVVGLPFVLISGIVLLVGVGMIMSAIFVMFFFETYYTLSGKLLRRLTPDKNVRVLVEVWEEHDNDN